MMMPERDYTRRFVCKKDLFCFITAIIISLALFAANVYFTLQTYDYLEEIKYRNCSN